MATIETNPQLGAQVKADAKEFVLHSWSVQSAIDPIPVAGAEGRSLLGLRREALPRLRVAARQRLDRPRAPEGDRGDQGAGGEAVHDRPADGNRAALDARADARGDHARQPEDVVLHERRRRGERERDQGRALGHRPAQDRRPLPLLPRRHGRSDHAHRRPAPLARRARPARRRPDARPVHLPLPGGPSRPVPRLLGRRRTSRRSSSTRARTPSPRSSSRPSSARTASSSRPTATSSRSARRATGTGSCSSATR